MPAWTFAATPHAARAAGLTPLFHDVDRRDLGARSGEVTETLRRISGKVERSWSWSPFGAPLDVPAWEAFEDRTGIPVVIDGAASFDTVQPTHIPFVVSLHATKILGAGEGGFIATTDSNLRDLLVGCCNFGFTETRIATIAALNAKMSEYHAAVALASLDRWPRSAQRMHEFASDTETPHRATAASRSSPATGRSPAPPISPSP